MQTDYGSTRLYNLWPCEDLSTLRKDHRPPPQSDGLPRGLTVSVRQIHEASLLQCLALTAQGARRS